MRKMVVGLVLLVGIAFGWCSSSWAVTSTVYLTKQNIKFPTKNGRVIGLVMEQEEAFPKPSEISEVLIESDRTGYGDACVARGSFDAATLRALVPAPNNGRELVRVKLKSGEYRYVNQDYLTLIYAKSLVDKLPPPVKLKSGYVQYGKYQKELLQFVAENRSLRVRFNSNWVSGIIIDGKEVFNLPVTDIEVVVWQSQVSGWENSTLRAPLVQKTTGQNIIGVIANMPEGDWGYVSFKIKSGTYAGKLAWINAARWNTTGAVSHINKQTGEVSYDFNPDPPPVEEASADLYEGDAEEEE